MNKRPRLPKVFIGIVIVIALIAFAEMAISVFFSNQYAARHGHAAGTIHMH